MSAQPEPGGIPMPAAVAARPRDHRGYPVLAITPWADGEPRFAATGTARTFICAVERRCSICGIRMESGPVWRVVADAEAAAIATSIADGHRYQNNAATVEAPGHRACMLYAAMVCPYLARPNARRGAPATAAGLAADRGDRRGAAAAVVGFAQMEYRLGDPVLFRFADVAEFLPHEVGGDHLAALIEAIATEEPFSQASPPYLLSDEPAAERHYARLRRSVA